MEAPRFRIRVTLLILLNLVPAGLDSAAGGETEDVRAIRTLRSGRAEVAAPIGIVPLLLDFLRRNAEPPSVFTAPGKPDAVFAASFGRVAVVLTAAG
ncbi:MAG TPA: hypothetical protein DEA80_00705 [Afipia sp.]|nr:hypothetical protein [Afipia sp.]HAO43680.1 hypothetical protein [Afipia sp.]HAP09284.1 hypothetical protein [Afipia sp.]HAP45991.1 hypothetical protein [Afipia sp.]HBF53379.1 hypothetical protein [Afipia sp.]